METCRSTTLEAINWKKMGLKEKYGIDGRIDNYKAKLVAKGYAQQQGLDFDEVFVSVANIGTIKMMGQYIRWKPIVST